MKTTLITLLSVLFAGTATAQKNALQPLIIQGKITNTTEKQLKIFFEDDNGKMTIDTIKLNNSGEFYLKTFNIKKPQRTSLQQNQLQINSIYVAPGYSLTITGDGTDYLTLLKTRHITGKGAAANQYRQKIDSILVARNDRTPWYELKLDSLLLYTRKSKALEDSVYQVVFSKPDTQDKYWNTFKRMISLDIQSKNFYMLLQHLEMNKYTYEQMAKVVSENTPAAFAKSVSNDEYLISEDYRSWVMPIYFAYSKKLDGLKDSNMVKQPDYFMNKTQALYSGKVKDLYLFNSIVGMIGRSHTIEELNNTRKDMMPRYIAMHNAAQKDQIDKHILEKEQQLMQMQIGKPAPAFSLPASNGKTYSLADFKGKVVYIDLWASWCAPCRAEIPNYRALYNKYKNDDRIAFMSLAVYDGEREWQKALKTDKPEWLQLYDAGGRMAQAYVASPIPKYIVIDKNGNIVSNNAPGPGGADIEKLLTTEMSK
ncbi:AhpC/TSA family protein [Mucilaginibacter limnophilus]|uniref:AhpC/TSA family protein n=1 Tax=Mucilaginibacter limnophilus TaxID=1932778 RepID=A0A3S3TH58_9SPHI|nr:TlpA disulfide reductase family protein [Mucilaginibacter limnophilus]RVU00920.1 AhpC/TSA family protein [Mucilaginibacter limnophilus]